MRERGKKKKGKKISRSGWNVCLEYQRVKKRKIFRFDLKDEDARWKWKRKWR